MAERGKLISSWRCDGHEVCFLDLERFLNPARIEAVMGKPAKGFATEMMDSSTLSHHWRWQTLSFRYIGYVAVQP